MTDRRRIEYQVGVNDQQFTTGTQGVLGRLRDMAGGFGMTDGMIRGATNAMGAFGLVMGGRKLLDYAGDAIQLAVAADEVRSKFEAVYGPAEAFRQKLSEWADVAGVTDTRALDLVATFGNLAMAQGLSKESTEDLAEKVWTLAGDMASFNDAEPEAVFYDLNKALLTTEREGLKKFGISVGEAEVKTRAMEIAVADGRDAVTQADRAMASYEIVVRQAGMANGDLERTADSAANQQRQLKADMQNLQEEIGQKLLPVYADLLELAVDLAPALDAVATALGGVIGPITGVSDFAKAATDNTGSFWDQVKRLDQAARNIVSPMGAFQDAVRDNANEVERGKDKTQEYRSMMDIMAEEQQEHADAAITAAGKHAEAADLMASSMEDAQRRVEAATNRWKTVLDDLVGAVKNAAAESRAQDFLGPGGFDQEARGSDLGSGQQSSSNQSAWSSVNGGPL